MNLHPGTPPYTRFGRQPAMLQNALTPLGYSMCYPSPSIRDLAGIACLQGQILKQDVKHRIDGEFGLKIIPKVLVGLKNAPLSLGRAAWGAVPLPCCISWEESGIRPESIKYLCRRGVLV